MEREQIMKITAVLESSICICNFNLFQQNFAKGSLKSDEFGLWISFSSYKGESMRGKMAENAPGVGWKRLQ